MTRNDWNVSITEDGRSGYVHYEEGPHTLSFYWEFGGGDVVVYLAVGTADEWAVQHPWAAPRRDEILQRVAAEVIRLRAPTCTSELDPGGWLNIVQRSSGMSRATDRGSAGTSAASDPRQAQAARTKAAADHFAASARKSKIVSYLALGLLIVSAILWAGGNMFKVKTIGSSFGQAMRTPTTIVSLVSRLEPYVPSLNRSGDKDRHRIGLLLHDAATGERRYVELARNVTSPDMMKSRLDVVRGDYVWALVPEPMRVQLSTGKVMTTQELARDPLAAAPPYTRSMAELGGSERLVPAHFAKGGLVAPDRWLGALEPNDVPGSFREGFRANAAEYFDPSRSPRRLWTATTRLDEKDHRFVALQQTGADSLFDGAFIRSAPDSGLLALTGGGALMLHYTRNYPSGTARVSRVDRDGRIVWQVDTGIHDVTDVLPDPDFPAFIGTRDPIPDKLPETILVVIDARTGAPREHSLWMKD